MTFLIALLLAAPSPTPSPPKIYVGPDLRNQGTSLGTVNAINCSGSGITCSRDGGVGTLRVSASSGDGGSSIVLPRCDAGYVLTSDGGALLCVNSITSAQTATALAANPTDCSSGGYASAIDSQANLTCSVPNGVPGGLTPQIQFNADGGTFAGMANFIAADGMHPTVLPDTSSPPVPSAGRTAYDVTFAPGMPPTPEEITAYFGIPVRQGLVFSGPFAPMSWLGSWTAVCHLPDTFNGTALGVLYGTATAVTSPGATSAWNFDAGTVMGRQKWTTAANTAGPNVWTASRETTGNLWRGNNAGAGGFIAWERLATLTSSAPGGGGNSGYVFAGWMPCGVALSNTADSSATTDTFYVGCDSADTNLHVCSNDSSGVATCTDLGASYPCRTPPHAYDIWFWAMPDDTVINWNISNIDSDAGLSGTLSSNLPNNAIYLCWQAARNSGHDAGTSTAGSIGLGGVCEYGHP